MFSQRSHKYRVEVAQQGEHMHVSGEYACAGPLAPLHPMQAVA